MTLDELIHKLQYLSDDGHGDLLVGETNDHHYGYHFIESVKIEEDLDEGTIVVLQT